MLFEMIEKAQIKLVSTNKIYKLPKHTVVVSSKGTSIVYPPQMTLDFKANRLKVIK